MPKKKPKFEPGDLARSGSLDPLFGKGIFLFLGHRRTRDGFRYDWLVNGKIITDRTANIDAEQYYWLYH